MTRREGKTLAIRSAGVRLLLLLVLGFVFSMATVPILKLGVEAVLPGPPWLQKLVRLEDSAHSVGPANAQSQDTYTYDIGRISRRWWMLVTLALFAGFRHWVPWKSLVRKGLTGNHQRVRLLLLGSAVGVVLVAAYAAILMAFHLLAWDSEGAAGLAGSLVEIVLGAAFVALFEEILMRGVFFRSMVRDFSLCGAIVVSSGVFAVLHCISGGHRVGPGWDSGLGLRMVKDYFISGGSVLPDLRLMAGLFILGCLLCLLYLWTGSLWPAIGLHGGLVLGSKLVKISWQRVAEFPEWLFGDERFIVSGVACWILLLVTLLLVPAIAPRGAFARRITRRPNRMES